MTDTVAVWRDHVLEFPETFIAGQAFDLQRWRGVLVGLERRHSPIALPDDRVISFGSGLPGVAMREVVRRLRWLPPGWLARIRALQPRLVHAHYTVDACHALPLGQQLGVPLLVTAHGYDVAQEDELSGRRTPTWRRYLRRRGELMAVAARFIAVSAYTAGRMCAKGFPAERIVVLPIGVDLGFFDGVVGDRARPSLRFVGRLSAEKGLPDLMAAVRRLAGRFPGLVLDVVGDGTGMAAARSAAAAMPVEVRLHGAVGRERVREMLRSAQVLCVPSRTSPTGGQETFGLVFAEAQAMRVPVVSYRIGGIPEAVADGRSGLLCREGDAAALAESLATLLADGALRQAMGEVGRSHVVANYDRRTCIAQLEALYDEVVNQGPTGRGVPTGASRAGPGR